MPVSYTHLELILEGVAVGAIAGAVVVAFRYLIGYADTLLNTILDYGCLLYTSLLHGDGHDFIGQRCAGKYTHGKIKYTGCLLYTSRCV